MDNHFIYNNKLSKKIVLSLESEFPTNDDEMSIERVKDKFFNQLEDTQVLKVSNDDDLFEVNKQMDRK